VLLVTTTALGLSLTRLNKLGALGISKAGTFALFVLLASIGARANLHAILKTPIFVLLGAFKAHWCYATLAVIGVLLGAAYLLWMFQRVFLGNFVYHGEGSLKDLGWRERIVTIPFIIMVFWIGIFPRPFLRTMDASLNGLIKQVERNYKKALAYGDTPTDNTREAAALRNEANDSIIERSER